MKMGHDSVGNLVFFRLKNDLNNKCFISPNLGIYPKQTAPVTFDTGLPHTNQGST